MVQPDDCARRERRLIIVRTLVLDVSPLSKC